ncbi:HEPN domain-containing protein [Candidatus Gottesmanbacteria bacterium]|nr:HEPN domain-containing protein [Candidatus Gottesmanbacteria bacterium]MBI3443408.1 HEPN domain-containing protein [Candidatus Woesebacteria bacterium]
MSQTEAIKYWIASAQEDWEVAQSLLKLDKYNHALFFLQLALEKLIKAVHVSRKDESPLYVHNLILLAQKAGIEFSEEELINVKEISSFNVSSRYDSYKRDFYKKATREFAIEWMKRGENLKIKLTNLLKEYGY